MKAVVLWTAFIIAGLAEKSALEHGHTRNPLQYLGQDGSIINHFRRNTAGNNTFFNDCSDLPTLMSEIPEVKIII